jgi:RND superfamily putative drug exporter
MSSGVKLLADNYGKLQAGFKEIGTGYQGAAQALLGVKGTLSQMQAMVAALGNNYTNSQSDPNYLGLKQAIDKLLESLNGITPEGINALNTSFNNAESGFVTANKSLSEISGGLSQMAAGLKKLDSGLGKAASGIGI